MSIEQSSNNKRIAKNTLFLYFRMLLTMVVGIYTSRVILQALGASDYGLNNVVAGFVSLFTIVNGTLASGTQRFLSFYLGKGASEQLKKVFNTAFWLHTGFAILFLIILEVLGLWLMKSTLNIPEGRENAATWVFQFAVLSTMVSVMQVPFNASLSAHEKFDIYAYMSFYDVGMKLLIVYLIQVTPFDRLITYSFLFFCVTVSSTLIYNIYCRKHFVECKLSSLKSFDTQIFKEIGSFAGWNIMGCAAVTCSGQGVNMVINIFFGTLVNAARGISTQVTGIVSQFVNNFLTAVNPQIIKMYAEGRITEMFSLSKNASKFGASLMLCLCIPLMLEMNYVLTLWLGEFPDHTIEFSICALVQAIITSISRPMVTILHATGQMKYPNVFSGTSLLLILPVTYILLKNGIDIDIVVAINILPWVCEQMFCLIFIKKYAGVPSLEYIPHVILKVFMIAVVGLLVGYYIQTLMNESFIRLIVVTGCSCICMLLTLYIIGLDKSVRKKLHDYVLIKLHRL